MIRTKCMMLVGAVVSALELSFLLQSRLEVLSHRRWKDLRKISGKISGCFTNTVLQCSYCTA